MPKIITALFLATVVSAAACGDDDANSESSASTTKTAAPTEPASSKQSATKTGTSEPKGTTIKVRDSQFGKVIWDGNRQAIYMFTKEKESSSRCYGECAEEWPPVLTKGKPVAGNDETRQKLLGTTKRKDGKLQVTYGDHPLYYYDEPRGVIRCQNVSGFGGLWLVVKPDGKPVR